MSATSDLATALANAITEFATYQAAYASNGYRPNFSINGVSINWPEYEKHMIDKIKSL